MEAEIYSILKYTIPALIVFVASFLIMKKFFDNEYRKQLFELKKASMKTITPIRLQAYERAALFLERIDIENMIKRVNKPTMKADQLHLNLMNAIRSEYEHNLSQQIYMSNESWEAIQKAKDETLKLIHVAKAQVDNKATSLQLAQVIFTLAEEEKSSPSDKALLILKKEIKHLF
jgi:hypothetical protein